MDADVIVVGAGLAGLAATAELAAAGRRVLLLDQEPESGLGGQAFWSFGGLFLVDSFEQRRMGIARLPGAGLAGLARQRVLRPRRRRPGRGRLLGLPVGAGLRRLRRRGEAAVAACDGGAVVPGGRLGRARRLPGRRARQFGAALPRHLGHRARGAGTVRAPRPGGLRPGRIPVPAPGRRAHRDRRSRRRRARSRARAQPGAPRGAQLTDRSRAVRAARAGGTGVLGRPRRQLRPDPAELAGPARAGRPSA